MAANVVINVKALTGQATRELDKIKRQFADLSTSAGWKNVVTGVGVGVGVGAYNALAGAVMGAGGALVEGVKSAAEEEAAIARLTAALNANVPAWDGNVAAVEQVIASRRALAFTDDELRASFSTLVGATGDISKAFAIQATAMDLARFRNIDLATASDALIRVEAGQYRALKSLGIVLREGATQTEALAAVQAVASGQAQAYADSTVGSFTKLGDAFDELKESIGAQFVPVVKAAADAITWFVNNREALVAAIAAVAAAIALVLLPKMIALAATVSVATAGLNLLIVAGVAAGAVLLTTGRSAVRSTKDIKNAGDALVYAQERAKRLSEAAGRLKDDFYGVGTAAEKMAGKLGIAAAAYQALLSKRRQSSLLKDDLWEGAAAVAEKLKAQREAAEDAAAAAASQASETAELVRQARAAVATLSGLRGMVGQLAKTMRSDWAPVTLTVAQAQANLTAATATFSTALGKLKPGVASTLSAVTSAFGRMKNAALAFYEAQRSARIADLNNAIAAVRANVQAFRDQLDGFRKARQQADLEEAARNARGVYSNALDQEIADLTAANREKQRTEEETRLKLAITQARTRKDRAAAQQALADYYARIHLEDLTAQREQERAVQQADENLLDFQQDQQLASLQSAADYQTQLYQQQIEAANAQYDAQVSALGKIAAAVEGGLEGVKGIWDTKNKQALAILNGFTSQFKTAGRSLAKAVEEGVASVGTIYIDVVTRYTTVGTPVGATSNTFEHRASGGPVTGGRTYWVGERGPELLTMGAGQSGYITPNGSGGGGQPAVIQLVLDGRKVAEVVDERLFLKYRTAARTGASI